MAPVSSSAPLRRSDRRGNMKNAQPQKQVNRVSKADKDDFASIKASKGWENFHDKMKDRESRCLQKSKTLSKQHLQEYKSRREEVALNKAASQTEKDVSHKRKRESPSNTVKSGSANVSDVEEGEIDESEEPEAKKPRLSEDIPYEEGIWHMKPKYKSNKENAAGEKVQSRNPRGVEQSRRGKTQRTNTASTAKCSVGSLRSTSAASSDSVNNDRRVATSGQTPAFVKPGISAVDNLFQRLAQLRPGNKRKREQTEAPVAKKMKLNESVNNNYDSRSLSQEVRATREQVKQEAHQHPDSSRSSQPERLSSTKPEDNQEPLYTETSSLARSSLSGSFLATSEENQDSSPSTSAPRSLSFGPQELPAQSLLASTDSNQPVTENQDSASANDATQALPTDSQAANLERPDVKAENKIKGSLVPKDLKRTLEQDSPREDRASKRTKVDPKGQVTSLTAKDAPTRSSGPGNPVSQHRRPVGLHNYSQACFMNATLQCLRTVEPLMNFCATLDRTLPDENETWNLNAEDLAKMSARFPSRHVQKTREELRLSMKNEYEDFNLDFPQRFARLMDKLEPNEWDEVCDPFVEQQVFGTMFRSIDDKIPKYGEAEEDANDFCWDLLTNLKKQAGEGALDGFKSTSRLHTFCEKCGIAQHHKATTGTSLELQAGSVPKSTMATLPSLIQKELQSNLNECPKCKTKNLKIRKEFITAPECLLARVARPDELVYRDVSFSVVPIEFANYLEPELKEDLARRGVRLTYEISGLVHYIRAGRRNSGHYTAFVRVDGQWYHANDDQVKPINIAELQNKRGGYMFFLTKKEVPLAQKQ